MRCHCVQAFVVSTTQGALFAQATQTNSFAEWKILKKGWGRQLEGDRQNAAPAYEPGFRDGLLQCVSC